MSFFDSEINRDLLLLSASTWMGTPFHANGCVKGHGVSCQALIAAIYKESGFFPITFEFPSADMKWGRTNRESQFDRWWKEARGEFYFDEFNLRGSGGDGGDPASQRRTGPFFNIGDTILINVGGCVHHGGIVVSDHEFIHVLHGYPVHLSDLRDPQWLMRLEKIWRPRA